MLTRNFKEFTYLFKIFCFLISSWMRLYIVSSCLFFPLGGKESPRWIWAYLYNFLALSANGRVCHTLPFSCLPPTMWESHVERDTVWCQMEGPLVLTLSDFILTLDQLLYFCSSQSIGGFLLQKIFCLYKYQWRKKLVFPTEPVLLEYRLRIYELNRIFFNFIIERKRQKKSSYIHTCISKFDH